MWCPVRAIGWLQHLSGHVSDHAMSVAGSVAGSIAASIGQRRCARGLLALALVAAPMPVLSAQQTDTSTKLLYEGLDCAAIDDYPGWSKCWRTEVLPMSVRLSDARWVVNYTEHLAAGGLTYRMLDEWYAAHGAPWPKAWAAATTFAAAMMNEAAEFPTAERAASSTVADLYVFDLGGILLFNWDPLARFFAHRLQAADWSNQATFTAPDGALRNTGQYYVLELPLPVDRWRLFVRGGMGAQFGLTLTRDGRVIYGLVHRSALGLGTGYSSRQ